VSLPLGGSSFIVFTRQDYRIDKMFQGESEWSSS
jgi:hypothetical protein